MARPRTMPISVYWPSFSKDDGLNQNSLVRSSYVNIPGGRGATESQGSVWVADWRTFGKGSDRHVALTDVWVEDLLHHQLEELFGNPTFVDALLPFELHVQLLFQVGWVLHGDHLQLGGIGGEEMRECAALCCLKQGAPSRGCKYPGVKFYLYGSFHTQMQFKALYKRIQEEEMKQ